jgi:hypothetical protein
MQNHHCLIRTVTQLLPTSPEAIPASGATGEMPWETKIDSARCVVIIVRG